MLQSFTVKNYRGFRELTIEPFARINLIAGKNNIGKTALLEAIYLYNGPGNLYSPLWVNLIRGLQIFPGDPLGLVEWLFFDKQTNVRIELGWHQRSWDAQFPAGRTCGNRHLAGRS